MCILKSIFFKSKRRALSEFIKRNVTLKILLSTLESVDKKFNFQHGFNMMVLKNSQKFETYLKNLESVQDI